MGETLQHRLARRAQRRMRVERNINHAVVRHGWFARLEDEPPGYVVLGTRWCNCRWKAAKQLGPHLHIDLYGAIFPMRSLQHVLTIVHPERAV